MEMNISGSGAVIVGAGSGIGEVVCRYLAEQGAKIVAIDKNENAALQVAKAVNGLALACDITDAKALEAAITKITSPIHIVINCAGIAPAQRMVGKEGPMALEWFDNVIRVNLIGTFNVMRLCAALMMKNTPNDSQERGVIINTASIAAFEGQIGQTAYSASKAGVIGLMLPAAREMARFGIRVMTIAPGLVDTPMLQGMPDEVRANLIAQTVFPKRFGLPKEYALLAKQIIENPLLNAEVIRLDGGMRMI
jgi:NAD(P)-dependent dehydrogenase (short-subunit alcohol dehydrogenase family)